MKHSARCFLAFLMSLILFLCACGHSEPPCTEHLDEDRNGICDRCSVSVLVYIDFFTVNDLHGKLADDDSHIGVDELTTYLKASRLINQRVILLSAGDMWQGSAESNMTKGLIVTEWMNELDFTAMALGNHEYDWGEAYIQENDALAEFPFLAINIYDRATNEPVSYCDPSVIVDLGDVQVGIIGAMGDHYSSIAVDKCEDVYFLVGDALTGLVKEESEELRQQGADFIVYVLHDGYGRSVHSGTEQISASQLSSYYDICLSDGYVDLVFEGHTHQGYLLQDEWGIYHLQNRGDNKGGISHAEVSFNTVTGETQVTAAELISAGQYEDLADDPLVEELLEKYDGQISPAHENLGYNSRRRSSDELRQLVADLYLEAGMAAWGDAYDIVLGGGFMSVRSPYELPKGEVTYADLQTLFPFVNQITLCTVSGRDLKYRFLETSHDKYFISCSGYGDNIRSHINDNATYYIVVDSYTAYYAPNNLTVVEAYDPAVFARDLLADYIKNGELS